MSASRNTRLAWICQEIKQGKTNAQIVLDCVTKFKGVSEKQARKDLKEILERLANIELDTLPEVKQKFLEMGFELLSECRKLAQMNAAVNQFKALAVIAGVISKDGSKPEGSGSGDGSPEAIAVRDRIAKLMANKKLRAEAEAAGIDLEALKNGQDNQDG